MRWYRLRHFKCPRCGNRLAVEQRQVERHELVTCDACNLDLLLAAKGSPVEAQPDPNTGERATIVQVG
jgi:hypothetical protein